MCGVQSDSCGDSDVCAFAKAATASLGNSEFMHANPNKLFVVKVVMSHFQYLSMLCF